MILVQDREYLLPSDQSDQRVNDLLGALRDRNSTLFDTVSYVLSKKGMFLDVLECLSKADLSDMTSYSISILVVTDIEPAWYVLLEELENKFGVSPAALSGNIRNYVDFVKIAYTSGLPVETIEQILEKSSDRDDFFERFNYMISTGEIDHFDDHGDEEQSDISEEFSSTPEAPETDYISETEHHELDGIEDGEQDDTYPPADVYPKEPEKDTPIIPKRRNIYDQIKFYIGQLERLDNSKSKRINFLNASLYEKSQKISELEKEIARLRGDQE